MLAIHPRLVVLFRRGWEIFLCNTHKLKVRLPHGSADGSLSYLLPDSPKSEIPLFSQKEAKFIMPQNANVQPLHFTIDHFEVSEHLEITVKVDLGLINQALPKKSLTVTEIAYHLSQRTGKKWTPRRVNEILEDTNYQRKHYWQWEPTIKGKQFADFSSRVLKWSPEVINLILLELSQQLRLAV